jgi:hypothetical protein
MNSLSVVGFAMSTVLLDSAITAEVTASMSSSPLVGKDAAIARLQASMAAFETFLSDKRLRLSGADTNSGPSVDAVAIMVRQCIADAGAAGVGRDYAIALMPVPSAGRFDTVSGLARKSEQAIADATEKYASVRYLARDGRVVVLRTSDAVAVAVLPLGYEGIVSPSKRIGQAIERADKARQERLAVAGDAPVPSLAASQGDVTVPGPKATAPMLAIGPLANLGA